MPRKRLPDPIKHCRTCGARLFRKRFPDGRLEDRTVFVKKVFCDRTCMARGYEGTVKVPNEKNSRRQSAKTQGVACEHCQATAGLHVHHIDENPMNNNPSNLATLCGSCHQRWHRLHGRETLMRAGPCRICGAPHKGLGYCQKHYQRFRKYGDPFLTKQRGGSHALLLERPDGSLSTP